MTKVITRTLLALTILFGLETAASRPAEAGRGGGVAVGVAAGTLLGLGIAGAYAGPRYYGPAYYGPGCYAGPRQCGWAGRSCWRNPYGETVCHGGEWRCCRADRSCRVSVGVGLCLRRRSRWRSVPARFATRAGRMPPRRGRSR